MDKNCKNCTFRERSYGEYPCDKCRNGSNWTPSDDLLEFAIAEFETERDKLLPKYRDGEVDEYNRGANDMLEEIIEHIDNRILELKGENNE